MATLLQRLAGDVGPEESRIPVHQFFAALVGMADGQATRAQVETLFAIGTAGTDKAQLDVLIDGYTAASDKGRYLTAVHAIFMLLENPDYTLTTAQITDWLTAAQAAY